MGCLLFVIELFPDHTRLVFLKIIFIDSTGILFSKLRSAGVNYYLPKLSFFTAPYCGVSYKHCILIFSFMLSLPGSYQTDIFAWFHSTSRYQDDMFDIVTFFNLIESPISQFTLVKNANSDDTDHSFLVWHHQQQMPKFHKTL